jgi:predicted Zn-dependent peptidase
LRESVGCYLNNTKSEHLVNYTEQARDRLINLEDLTEEEMDKVKRELTDIGRADRDNPDTPP